MHKLHIYFPIVINMYIFLHFLIISESYFMFYAKHTCKNTCTCVFSFVNKQETDVFPFFQVSFYATMLSKKEILLSNASDIHFFRKTNKHFKNRFLFC